MNQAIKFLSEKIWPIVPITAIPSSQGGAARRLLKKEKANEYEINEALEYSKRSNDLEADNPKYLDTLAEAYLLSGDKDKAKEINDKAKILAQKLKSSELLKTILDRENKISAK